MKFIIGKNFDFEKKLFLLKTPKPYSSKNKFYICAKNPSHSVELLLNDLSMSADGFSWFVKQIEIPSFKNWNFLTPFTFDILQLLEFGVIGYNMYGNDEPVLNYRTFCQIEKNRDKIKRYKNVRR